MIYGWSPTIGDPTLYGWLTVVAYFATVVPCYLNWRNAGASMTSGPSAYFRSRARRRLWLVMTATLVALGINKQLDIQTLFTDIGRVIAKQQGWYMERRGVQYEFIVAVGAIAAVCAAIVPFIARRAGTWEIVAAIGLTCLFAFVFIRAASFHHIDAILSLGLAGIRVNHVMELGGILIIAFAAVRRLRDPAATRINAGRADRRGR